MITISTNASEPRFLKIFAQGLFILGIVVQLCVKLGVGIWEFTVQLFALLLKIAQTKQRLEVIRFCCSLKKSDCGRIAFITLNKRATVIESFSFNIFLVKERVSQDYDHFWGGLKDSTWAPFKDIKNYVHIVSTNTTTTLIQGK